MQAYQPEDEKDEEDEEDNEFGDSVVGDILSNWRLIVGGVVLALAAYILGPLLGPVAELFKTAFGAAVGSVAFLAEHPWLIPLLGLLGMIGPMVYRRFANARDRNKSAPDKERARGNMVAMGHNLRRPGEFAAAGEPMRTAGATPGEVERAVAESAMRGASIEQDGLGVLSAATAERVHRLAQGVAVRETMPDGMNPLVFQFVQKLHAKAKSTPDAEQFVKDVQRDPIPGPGGLPPGGLPPGGGPPGGLPGPPKGLTRGKRR